MIEPSDAACFLSGALAIDLLARQGVARDHTRLRYLLDLCVRVGLLKHDAVQQTIDDYSIVIKSLQALITKIGG